MKTKLILVPILLILSSVFFFGCFGVDNDFSKIKHDIISTANFQFHKDIEFSIGSAGLSFASAIVDFSDDNDAREIIRHLSKVQVGVYNNIEPVSRQAAIEILRNIDGRLQSEGWNYIVKSYEKGEVNSIYVKQNNDNKLREMFVINLTNDKLTIVNLKGNLEKILSSVIRDRKMNLSYND